MNNLQLATDDALYIEAIAANYSFCSDVYGKRHYERLMRIAAKLKNKSLPAEQAAQSQPAPPVPSSVQEIMRLMMPYIDACGKFETETIPEFRCIAEDEVAKAFSPLQGALVALVDDNHRLKFELDGVRAMRGPMEWTSVDAERPVMADEDDDVEVWTWDGISVLEDEYGAIFEQPAGPAVGGWLRVGDGFSGDSYTRQATHWMPRHKPAPPTSAKEDAS